MPLKSPLRARLGYCPGFRLGGCFTHSSSFGFLVIGESFPVALGSASGMQITFSAGWFFVFFLLSILPPVLSDFRPPFVFFHAHVLGRLVPEGV